MMRRRPRPSALAAGTVMAVLGLLGASCASSNAAGLVRQACQHVERSLRLYEQSLHEAPAQQAADQARAEAELQAAEAPVATAAGEDGRWQGLMTSLSQSIRVPESDLVGVLRVQCAPALGGGSGG